MWQRNRHRSSVELKSCILDALSKLDEFLLNPQARVHSGTILETSPNSKRENQETKRMVPRMILILKWVSLRVIPLKILTQTRLPTLPMPQVLWKVFSKSTCQKVVSTLYHRYTCNTTSVESATTVLKIQ